MSIISIDHSPDRIDIDLQKLDLRPPIEMDAISGEPIEISCKSDNQEDGIAFSINGAPFHKKKQKWICQFESVDLQAHPYITIECKADGLLRDQPIQPVLSCISINGENERIETPLLLMTHLITDGKWHTIINKIKIEKPISGFSFELVSQDSNCGFCIRSMAFAGTPNDLHYCCEHSILDRNLTGDFTCVDLLDQFNAEYDRLLNNKLGQYEITPLQKRREKTVIVDGGKFFSNDEIQIDHIPFKVQPAGKNMIAPPAESGVNDEIIDHFGLRVRRGQVAPVSRDDRTEVEINQYANEVYFLMASDIPATKQFKYLILDSVVDGQLFDEIRMPNAIADVECFVVELVYEDGSSDKAFPYSLRDNRFVIQGMLGVYGVPSSSSKKLEKIIFYNRVRASQFNIVAITANRGSNCYFAKPIAATSPGVNQKTNLVPLQIIKPFIKMDGHMIQLGNSMISLEVDTTSGFHIKALRNHCLQTNPIVITETSALRLQMPFGQEKENPITLQSACLRSDEGLEIIELSYASQIDHAPIELIIEMAIADKPEISMKLSVMNHADVKISTDIVFPVIENLYIGNIKDTWYLFPKYRNVISSSEGTFCSQTAPTFPMQFYDIYNPVLGAGCTVMTKETGYTIRKYGLMKNKSGVTCYIQYPSHHTQLNPGEKFTCSETVIGMHRGDWHTALQNYKNWLASWYKPYKAHNKLWYRKCFWLIAEITDALETGIFKLPAWYDESLKRYKMRDIVEEHRRLAGRYPDILHLWAWCYSLEESNQIYGGYGKEDYDRLGGLEGFRNALDDIQKNMNIAVSLYMNATLCHKSYPIAHEIGKEGCMVKEDGSLLMVEGTNYRMCHSFEKWRKYMAGNYERVYRETGAKILYVDEFSLLENNVCFSEKHGHQLPLNLIKADHDFIEAVRDALPEEVVLYGEFPAVDLNSQYIDCNINYYNVDMVVEMIDTFCDMKVSGQDLSPVITNLYRFVFPSIVQLNLPAGIRNGSWHPLKFTFFNGEAIYDCLWEIEETRAHDFILRAYDIKKAYADCFSSDNPETLVPTEMSEVCANKFPGNGRTIWTLYNQAYRTARGRILSIEHTEGSRYFDVWNNHEIKPDIIDGRACLSLEIGPQSVGCIEQRNDGHV